MDEELELRIALLPEPHIVEVGPQSEYVLGYSPAAFLHDPKLLLARTHPDDLPVVRTLLTQPTQFARPVTYRAQHRSGAWVWLEQRHGVADATSIKAFIRVVHTTQGSEAGEQFRMLVENSVEALTILDIEGTVRYENPAVEHVLGYKPDEQVGHTAFDFIHPDDIPEVSAAFAGIASTPGAQARRRYRHMHKDGSWRLVESVAQNALDNPLIRGIIIHTFAVDERRRLEQQVTDASTALRMLAESRAELIGELQRTQRKKDELTALLVHDLKSPLNAILLNTDLLREVCDDQAVLAIEQAAKSLLGMALDLLDISRSEDGALVPQLGEVDVARFVGGVARTMSSRGILDLDVALAHPLARFDESLVERVIMNFLDNAYRHTAAGTVPRIIVRDDLASLEMRVCDRGPGVPDAQKQRVFEKYVQLEPMHAGRRGNRGLGLVFCKLAATAHGGQVWVEDNEPSGAQFCLRLPR